ncbi:iron-siderophore ABC transporter substrate-binding protein [Saccharopolyspora spinosa]|uniref:iron-siderophore ABC transporter substrate-binding protein n=1 Tax=Saccharopolyspora spinosa TaxID=60894 RepID=UPI001658E74A|nr:iron-siderophore ABC transporter substrate-binding protein [Saccharopolyspora spinosa]
MRSSGLRTRGLVMTVLLGVVLALTGCGAPAAERETTGSEEAAGQFPVTIPTAFGDVTVPKRPQRVVALGWGDAEVALTLGVQPVGAADWLPVGGDGVPVWMPADKQYAKRPAMLGTLEVDMEAVAALEPDLILDTRASGERSRYDLLSGLGVPVVSIPPDGKAYRTDWEDQLDMIAKALGKSAEAQEVRAGVEESFRKAAAAHPEFAGKTTVVGSKTVGSYGAYVNGGSRIEFMERLGFVQSPQVQSLAGDSFSVKISPERMDLLNADFVLMSPIGVSPGDIAGDPLFRAVPAVQAGHSVVLSDAEVAQAFASGTALGMSHAVEKVVPLIAQAMAN